jgi:hypothetical protein
MYPVEIKSAQTLHPDFWKGVRYFNGLPALSCLVYGGSQNLDSAQGNVRSRADLPKW